MFYNNWAPKQFAIIIAAVGIFFLCSKAFADDLLPENVHANYDLASPSQSVASSHGETSLSLELTLEEESNINLDIAYAQSNVERDDFRFEEIDNPRKADPYTVFRLAMDEFQVFHPLKQILEDVKKRLDDYAKKMKFKGKIVFPKNDFSRPKIQKEINLQIGTNIQKNPRNKLVGFTHRFMPDEINWKFALVFDDKYVTGISGEIGLGEYIEVEGKFAKEKDIEVKFEFPF